MITIDSRPVSHEPEAPATGRRIVLRTRGRGHGEVFRLISPGDLGEHLKPFVFLDSFGGVMSEFAARGGMHPHSGIGTVTVFTRGDVRFEDPEAGGGHIGYGGVEWMRAGGGVWHGKELSSGTSARIHGFQLWLALPAGLELSDVDSQYIEAKHMRRVGPAHVIVGKHEGIASPVRAPVGINYLLVTLGAGEQWTYRPPQGHTVGWLAISAGNLTGPSPAENGELLIFDDTDGAIALEGGSDGATFVLGSAIPHPHDLHLGYYSVHTSADALKAGEKKIGQLREALELKASRTGPLGSTPIFRG